MVQKTSELSFSLELSNAWGVVSEWLVDVVGVESILGSLLLIGVAISLLNDFLLGDHVSLQHFGEENGVNFDIMCRQSVVEVVLWEQLVVPLLPELDSILAVEGGLVSDVVEDASGQDHASAPEVAEQC